MTPSSAIDTLWQRYRADGDPEVRAMLLDEYLGLVHHCARELAARLPASVELDDLMSAGALGLIRALESFDLGRGLAFSTYAIRRIRGAMLDDLRARDWRPRSVRARARQVEAATNELEQALGRRPTPQELAERLGITPDTLAGWQADLDAGTLVSLDAAPQEGAPRLEETLRDTSVAAPEEALDQADEMARLREAMAHLPERERLVLTLYHFEELSLRQIAEVLHVTESRVSQIRTQALRRLRQHLQEDRP
ncbi:MAG: sigma-70 family RNA polymerase sigma factor [Gemmatimonadota bacterium]